MFTYRKKLTAVDNLDANVISKFPLRPRSAGTKMKTSVTFLNTSQCCKKTKKQNFLTPFNLKNTLE